MAMAICSLGAQSPLHVLDPKRGLKAAFNSIFACSPKFEWSMPYRPVQGCALKKFVLGVQVAAERHSEELRAVCVDITANCLPDVLVRLQDPHASTAGLLIVATCLDQYCQIPCQQPLLCKMQRLPHEVMLWFDAPNLHRKAQVGISFSLQYAYVDYRELQGADSRAARTGAELCEGDQHPPRLPNARLLSR